MQLRPPRYLTRSTLLFDPLGGHLTPKRELSWSPASDTTLAMSACTRERWPQIRPKISTREPIPSVATSSSEAVSISRATPDGNRLLAHELTHVRQQSTGAVLRSVVQRYPDKDDWSLFENTFAGEPRFVFWAKKHGKPPVTYIEQMNLLDQYNLVKDTKDVLEEFDRAQTGRDKNMLEARRQRARAAEERSAATKPELAAQQRIGERKRNRPFLDQAIEKALKERWRYNSTEWAKQARFDLHHYVRLQEGLVREHFPSPEHRWVYIYYYITEYYGMEASSIDVSMVVPDLREQEEIYLENSAKGADAGELSMFRKGVPQAARSARIRKLAETQPMNPVDNFEPGIHDYSPYPGPAAVSRYGHRWR